MLNLTTIKEAINTATFNLPVSKFGFGFSSSLDGEVKTMVKAMRPSIFSRKYRLTVVFNNSMTEEFIGKESFEVIKKLVLQHNKDVDEKVSKLKKEMTAVSELVYSLRIPSDKVSMQKVCDRIAEEYNIGNLRCSAQNYVQEIGVDEVNNFNHLCSYLEGIQRAL